MVDQLRDMILDLQQRVAALEALVKPLFIPQVMVEPEPVKEPIPPNDGE